MFFFLFFFFFRKMRSFAITPITIINQYLPPKYGVRNCRTSPYLFRVMLKYYTIEFNGIYNNITKKSYNIIKLLEMFIFNKIKVLFLKTFISITMNFKFRILWLQKIKNQYVILKHSKNRPFFRFVQK